MLQQTQNNHKNNIKNIQEPCCKSKKRAYVSNKSILSISLVLLILLISLIISLSFLHLHRNIIKHYITSKALFALRILNSNVGPHLLKQDFDKIHEQIKNITFDKDIIYVAILDPKGILMLESKKGADEFPLLLDPLKIADKVPKFLPYKDPDGEVTGYDVFMQIPLNKKSIGISRIVVSFKDTKQTLFHIRNILIVLICLLALFEGIFCLILLNSMNKPIRELVNASERIANGDFNIEVEIQSKTDISLLAQSFNKMSANIREYRDKIISKSNELKAIIDSMGSGLFTVDKEWKITSLNDAVEKMTGYKKTELIGKTCQEVIQSNVCHKECPLEKSLKEDKSITANDIYIKHKDGRKIPVSSIASPLKNEAGEIIGGVEVFKDLTEIKELQKQLIQADKMAALGQMVSSIAHDINNPTGVLHSNMISLSEYSEIIRVLLDKYRNIFQKFFDLYFEKFSTDLSDLQEYEQHHDINYILEDLDCLVEESKEAAARITKIVKNLRDFIHVDVGEFQLADLNQQIDVSLNLIKFDGDIKIIKEYSPIASVNCNVQQIDQVFTNILLNAVQALGKKGEIRIRTMQTGNRVRIAIRDNGPGIPEEVLTKIFDPFFTTKEVGLGTGLGLSICFKIVSYHGGKIWAESEEGKGTEFFIELPINQKRNDAKRPLSS